MDYESDALLKIHDKAIIAKNECFFVGFIDGVLANNRIDETEVEPLLAECEAICRLVRDEDAAEIIMEASAGHADTVSELLDLLTQISEIRSARIEPDCRRSSANQLLGFCAGINCDAIITTQEARLLLEKVCEANDLEDDPRIEALKHSLFESLRDDEIDPLESDEISLLITALVGDSFADTGIPSSDAVPVIQDLDEIEEKVLEGTNVVLTGAFHFGTRKQVADRLSEFGATVQANPTKATEIIIIGTEGSPFYTHKHHGGKLAKALKMRANGSAPRIYVEGQLHGLL